MARRRKKTITDRIFENILFLEEVFGDKDDADIPDVPVLELAYKSRSPKIPVRTECPKGHRTTLAAQKEEAEFEKKDYGQA